MRFSALVLIVGLLGGCAVSRTGKALNVAVVGSGVADVVTTHYALERGGREWNRIAGDEEWRRWLVKSAGVSGVIGAAHLLELKGKPILAHLVRGVAIWAWTLAARHNHRIGR